jgi:hypothetical protein
MNEVLKQMYQLLLTEPHAPAVCDQLEVILRQAIADLESQEPVAWVDVKDTNHGPYEFHGKELLPVGKHDLYTTPPAQPAQRKPLTSKDFEEFVKAELGDTAVSDNGRYISPKIQNYWKIWEHCNTAPPAAQRTWVGLTDEERSQLVTLHHGWNEYGQAIEAKLKEKNT